MHIVLCLLSRSVATDTPPLEGHNLFVSDEQGSDGPLQNFMRYSENVSTWVSAEIVISDSLKVNIRFFVCEIKKVLDSISCHNLPLVHVLLFLYLLTY